FGHCVKVFYRDAFAKHQEVLDELGVNVNNGMVDLYNKIEKLPSFQREQIIRDIHEVHENRPELAMVDSARGITNFHSPSDVIVDASMPAMIRLGGKMYGADGRTKDTKAVNPESTFSRIYQEMINWCKTHGQFDPTTMGTVQNVGTGDIWRMPIVKDAAIRDWVKLAVNRGRASGMTVLFWLDTERPHEA